MALSREKLDLLARLTLAAIFIVLLFMSMAMLGCGFPKSTPPPAGGGGFMGFDWGGGGSSSDPTAWALAPVVGAGSLSMLAGVALLIITKGSRGAIPLGVGVGLCVGSFLLLKILGPIIWVLIVALIVGVGIGGWHVWHLLEQWRVARRAKRMNGHAEIRHDRDHGDE
jgi:hypothetical protein